MTVLGGGGTSYERGNPVLVRRCPAYAPLVLCRPCVCSTPLGFAACSSAACSFALAPLCGLLLFAACSSCGLLLAACSSLRLAPLCGLYGDSTGYVHVPHCHTNRLVCTCNLFAWVASCGTASESEGDPFRLENLGLSTPQVIIRPKLILQISPH